MIAFLHSLSIWLADFFLLATLLLAASLSARLLVRQPAGRVGLAWATWLALAAVAALTALPAWPRYNVDQLLTTFRSPSSTRDQRQPAHRDPVESPPAASPLQVSTVPRTPEPQHHPTTPKSLSLPAGLAAAWLVGCGLGTGWILLGLAQTCRLLRCAVAVPSWVHDELRRIVGPRSRPPRTWASHRVTSAIALGALKPRIILSRKDVAESNLLAIRAALAHEWAHIRHGDLRLLALERLLLPLVSLHPLFWWLRRNVRLEQELLADAAAAGDQPVEYAELLIAWARTAQPARHRSAALAIWERPSTLSRRIFMLLNSKRPINASLGRLRVIALAMLVAPAVLGLSLITLRPLAAQQHASAPSTAAVVSSILPNPPPAESSADPRSVMLQMQVLTVDSGKLTAEQTTLEDLIAEVTNSRCALEQRVVVADLAPGEEDLLIARLKSSGAMQVLSRPQIITLAGQQAHVQISGAAPSLIIDNITNGRLQRRQPQQLGTLITILPTIEPEGKDPCIRLKIEAGHARLSLAEVPDYAPGPDARDRQAPEPAQFVSHHFKLTRDLEPGRTLLAAESPAEEDRPNVKQQLVLLVAAQQPPAAAQPTDSKPPASLDLDPAEAADNPAEQLKRALAGFDAAFAQRAKENASLRRQVEELRHEVARLKGLSSESRQAPAITLYPLQNVRAEQAAEVLSKILKKTHPAARVQSDLQDNSLLVTLDQQHMDKVTSLVEALDQPHQPLSADPPHRSSAAGFLPGDQRTQQQLLELDLADAQLAVREAEAELASIADANQKAPGAIPQHELDKRQLKLDRAKIQLRRVQVQLQALNHQPPRDPAQPPINQ